MLIYFCVLIEFILVGIDSLSFYLTLEATRLIVMLH